MAFKLGRKPAVHTLRTMRSALAMARALDPLGDAPPTSIDYVSAVNAQSPGGWMMLGNDEWGDCVEAAEGHYLMLRTANTGQIVVPTTQQTLALYSAETGFNPDNPNTDQGTDETSDCQYMVSTGFLGHKADATGSIDPYDYDHLRWAVQLFGGVHIGANLPQSAMEQFDAGQPWTVVQNDGGIVGGHDPLLVKYDGTWCYVVTWAKLQPVAPDWIARYVDEAHVQLFGDWIEDNQNSPSGFDLQALLSDLRSLERPSSTPGLTHRRHRRRRLQRQAQPAAVHLP